MYQFCIVNENKEDTFEATGSLQDAIRLAIRVASQSEPGDLIAILEPSGKAIRQFERMPNGTVVEHTITSQGTVSSGVPGLKRA